jgi:phosphohistidine swiveling domain-containing protein
MRALHGFTVPDALFVEQKIGLVHCYMDDGQLGAFRSSVARLLETPERTMSFLHKGRDANEKARGIMEKKTEISFDEAIDVLIMLGLYSTNLPRMMLSSEKPLPAELKEAAQALRKESLYPSFIEEVVLPIVKRQLKDEEKKHADLLTYNELRTGHADIRERIEQRKKGQLFFYAACAEETVSWHDSTVEYILGLEPDHTSNHSMVRGIVAYAGKAKGKVRIVESPQAPFHAGEILVSSSPSPVYNHMIRKAAAIVADEGGSGCHAAIIAREMKIPCIVGTERATRTFKDGDLVEVDTENGIVRRIS